MASTIPPTAARLSSLSTTTLSQILELTRSTQLGHPSPSLPTSISKNLIQLHSGIERLAQSGTEIEGGEVLLGLQGQYERLVGLVEGLGVHVEYRTVGRGKGKGKWTGKGKTGKLVETDDVLDSSEDDPDDDSGITLQPLSRSPPHVAISFPPTDEDVERDLERMEEDEATMRKANAEVIQMQQRMMDDQDETLTSLSSAIARQHQLSLHISSELELQESLLESTDAAVERTQTSLRRASGRLNHFTNKAKETGSTGLIIALVILLAILIVIFKF